MWSMASAIGRPLPSSTFEDVFPMILQKLRMRTQFGIYRKQNFTIKIEEAFDRIRNKLLDHEDFIVVRQRKKPPIEHPVDAPRKSDTIPN